MISVLALTQLAFLTLGVVLMRIMVRANDASALPSYASFMTQYWVWLYLGPLCWIAYAHLAQRMKKAPFDPKFAQALGFILAAAYFAFFATVTFVRYR